MKKFVHRESELGINRLNKSYTDDNIYFPNFAANGVGGSVGLGNCTWYAWGRYLECSGERPTGISGNGNDFYHQAVSAGLETSQTPRVASMVSFDSNFGPFGHVAFIEKIDEDGTIWISHSNYGKDGYDGAWFFKYQTMQELMSWDSSMVVLGYIYAPVEIDGDGGIDPPDKRKGIIPLIASNCLYGY